MSSRDDLVFGAVRARVESGDYLDHRVGFPGVNLERGGAFEYAPDGRLQRWYLRGTPAYDAAHAAGLLVPLPPLSPASPEALADFETHLGRPLPALLRRCYTELGDGGFGPGYALPSLVTMLEDYRAQQQHWPEAWPATAAALLPICQWGCGIASFVDVSDPAYQMWAIDPTEPDQVPLFVEPFDFTEWMYQWTVGAWMLPCVPHDDSTGQCHDGMDADVSNTNDPSDDPWADTGDLNSSPRP